MVHGLSEKHDLQRVFLQHCKDNRVPVSVFLTNGVKLGGVIARFDAFTLVVSRYGAEQVVYKQAVSTIAAERPISLWQKEPGEGEVPARREPARGAPPPERRVSNEPAGVPAPRRIDPDRLKEALKRLKRD
jgi:host factor-I protein